jgi:hypothetical protein
MVFMLAAAAWAKGSKTFFFPIHRS